MIKTIEINKTAAQATIQAANASSQPIAAPAHEAFWFILQWIVLPILIVILIIMLILVIKAYTRGRKRIKRNVVISGQLIKSKKGKMIDKELEIYETYNFWDDYESSKIRRFFKRFKYFFWTKFRNSDLIGINMQFESGKFKEFIVPISKKSFKFAGGTYAVDTDLKYDKVNSKYYWLDYHESFCLPIKRSLKISPIINSMDIKNKQTAEIALSTNPQVLDKVLKAQMAQDILSVKEETFIVIVMILLVVSLLVNIYGAYSSSKIQAEMTKQIQALGQSTQQQISEVRIQIAQTRAMPQPVQAAQPIAKK